MWDNGYVDRPPEQWIMHQKHNGGRGRSETIYALTNKGMRFLEDELGYSRPKTDMDKKNRELGETTIFHDVTLTQMWAGLHTGLEQKRERTNEQYNLVSWYQDRADREHLKTEIVLRNGQKVNIIPDAAFKLQCPVSQYLFFVEYYRTRKGGNQTYLNKLKYYNLYYKDKKKLEKYRVKKGFRVLTIVPSRAIVENLIKLIDTNPENAELKHFKFWFVSEQDYRLYKKERATEKSFRKTKDVESILGAIFRTPVDEKMHSLEE